MTKIRMSTQLAQDGAVTGNVPVWDGTKWAPGTSTTTMPPSLPSGTSLAKQYDPKTQGYNLSQSSLLQFRTALAGVRASDTQGPVLRVLIAGDSRTQGTGSGTPLYNHNWGSKLRALLSSAVGLPATDGAVWATDAGPFDDARITQGSGWSVTLGMNSGRTPATACGFGGGGVFTAATTATGTLGFAPDTNIGSGGVTDTLRVFYLNGPGFGTVTVKNGATTLGTINADTTGSGGAYGEAVATFTATRGANAYSVSFPTVGTFYVIGVEAYDSTTPCISVSNCGTSGSGTAYWNNANAGAVQGSGGAWSLYKPPLTVIPLGVNDSNSAAAAFVSSSTYQTNLGQIVDQARSNGGDVILWGDYQSPATNQQSIQSYVVAAYAVADSKDAALFDLNSRWPAGGGTPLGPSGYALLQSDLVHPSPRGHYDMADAVAILLRSTAIPGGGTGSGSSGGYTSVQDEGVGLTARTVLDFAGIGVTATDDATNSRTLVTVSAVELLMTNGVTSPPVPVTTEDGTDWLYQG